MAKYADKESDKEKRWEEAEDECSSSGSLLCWC